jgi:hypothetical protein
MRPGLIIDPVARGFDGEHRFAKTYLGILACLDLLVFCGDTTLAVIGRAGLARDVLRGLILALEPVGPPASGQVPDEDASSFMSLLSDLVVRGVLGAHDGDPGAHRSPPVDAAQSEVAVAGDALTAKAEQLRGSPPPRSVPGDAGARWP